MADFLAENPPIRSDLAPASTHRRADDRAGACGRDRPRVSIVRSPPVGECAWTYYAIGGALWRRICTWWLSQSRWAPGPVG